MTDRGQGEEEEFEVEAVVNSYWTNQDNQLRYIVKWVGYPQEDERQAKDLLPGADKVVETFHRSHPDKPGPLKDYSFDKAAWVDGKGSVLPNGPVVRRKTKRKRKT